MSQEGGLMAFGCSCPESKYGKQVIHKCSIDRPPVLYGLYKYSNRIRLMTVTTAEQSSWIAEQILSLHSVHLCKYYLSILFDALHDYVPILFAVRGHCVDHF